MVRYGLGLFILGIVACAPAGPPRGLVSGRVTRNGHPVTVGSVVFENLSLGVSQATNLNADGTYEMSTYAGPGILPGSYRVAIRPDRIGTGETPVITNPTTTVRAVDTTSIPSKYHHPSSSPFSVDIQPGLNRDANFDLVN